MEFPTHLDLPTLLPGDRLEELMGMLGVDDKTYKESHVYNRVSKKNVTDRHLRSSEKIEYRDEKLFDWVDTHIVGRLAQPDMDHRFLLVRNDVEVVRYNEGDFFGKHQDYVNFESAEFKNYTLLLCLSPCDEGGETVLDLGAGSVTTTTTSQNPGGVLLFRKETVHEGLPVKRGQKMILKANLMCFVRPLETEEYVVVEVTRGGIYVIPVSAFTRYPGTLYEGFYKFQKASDPSRSVFHYRETQLDEVAFRFYYERLMGIDTRSSLTTAMDYIGLPVNILFDVFNNFGNTSLVVGDTLNPVFLCGANLYYRLLPLCDGVCDGRLLPVQVVSFTSHDPKRHIIAWMGFYDNVFATCDYPKSWMDDAISMRRIVRARTAWQRAFNDKTRFGHREFLLGAGLMADIIRWNLRKSDLDPAVGARHRRSIWRKYGLRHRMAEIMKVDPSARPLDQVDQYVTDVINDLTAHDSEEAGEIPAPRHQWLLQNGYRLFDNPPAKIDPKFERLRGLDLDKVLALVEGERDLSRSRATHTSIYSCNENQYVTLQVDYRFGFLRITDDLFKGTDDHFKRTDDGEGGEGDPDDDDGEGGEDGEGDTDDEGPSDDELADKAPSDDSDDEDVPIPEWIENTSDGKDAGEFVGGDAEAEVAYVEVGEDVGGNVDEFLRDDDDVEIAYGGRRGYREDTGGDISEETVRPKS